MWSWKFTIYFILSLNILNNKGENISELIKFVW